MMSAKNIKSTQEVQPLIHVSAEERDEVWKQNFHFI